MKALSFLAGFVKNDAKAQEQTVCCHRHVTNFMSLLLYMFTTQIHLSVLSLPSNNLK